MTSCEKIVLNLLKNTLACAGTFSTDTIFVELWALDHSYSEGVRLVRPDCGVWLEENQLCLLLAASGSNDGQEKVDDQEEKSYEETVLWDPYCIFHRENVRSDLSGASATEETGDGTVSTSAWSEIGQKELITCSIGVGIAGTLFSDSSTNRVRWRQVHGMAIDPFIMDRNDNQMHRLLALDECQGLVGNYNQQTNSSLEKYIDFSISLDLIRERHGRVPESVDWVGGVGTRIQEEGKEKGGVVVFAARSTANFDDLRSDCNESFMVEISHIIAEVWSLVIEVRSLNKSEDQLASPFIEGLKVRVDDINMRMQNLGNKRFNGEVCGPTIKSGAGSGILRRIMSLFKF
mmetsp:Transcript_19209/g.40346  ORF Transcript_19209/g.40346 Transcript_19209/m.40346 type:complete len:347 (+) Transcript_19209:189-1229(+)